MGSAKAADVHNVLILNSYHAGFKGTDDMVAGINQVFEKSGLKINTKIEYLDSKHFSGPAHDKLVLDTLRAKYQKHNFELLLAADDYAFNLVESHRDELFGKIPVVFAGTNYFNGARLLGKTDYIGIDESPSFADTIALILSLHPDTKRVVAIHDLTVTGQLNSRAFNDAAQSFASRIQIDSLAGLQMEDLQSAVTNFQPGTVAVYFASNVTKQSGGNLSSNDALRSIASISPVPIYGGWAFSLGHGIVGGRLIDLHDHGVAAGQMAARLLQGETAQSLSGLAPSPNTYLFDQVQLDRFKVNAASLPNGSVIINKPQSFYEQYNERLFVGMLLIVVVAVSISYARVSASRRALGQSQERLQLAMVAARQVWFDADLKTGEAKVGPEYPRMLGYEPQEFSINIQNWMASIHPADAPKVQAQFQQLLLSGNAASLEYRQKNKAGEWQWIQSTGKVVEWDTEGKARRLTGTHQDIAERKQTELALLNEQQLSADMINSLPGVFYMFDASGRFLRWNRHFKEVTGYSDQELAAMQGPDFFPDTDRERVAEAMRQTFQNGESSVEALFLDHEGKGRPYHFTGTRMMLGGQAYLLGVGLDITERKAAEAELDKYRHHLEELVQERTVQLTEAKVAAEAANRAKSAFLANMSHELRTPMNGVMGMIEMARRRMADAKGLDQLDKAKLAAKRLLGILNDILDISKIEAERLVFEKVPLQLSSVLEDLIDSHGHKATDKGLRLQVDIPDGLLNQHFEGDPLRLGQILVNLVGNAIKFTDHGEVVLRARPVGETPETVQVCFEVSDTGIGIAPEAQRRLFQSFEQADNSMTRKYGGTGLGLAISKRLVELMGGEISVESTPGQGSTFRFVIPCRKPQVGAAPVAATPQVLSADQRLQTEYAGARVLLVEDEPFAQDVSSFLLEEVGFVVDIAEDGQQALQLSRQNRYALILMDMQMPVMNGVDATVAIRANSLNKTTPILAMTANAFDEDRDACFAAGMNAHISKPVDPQTAYETMLAWLEKRSG